MQNYAELPQKSYDVLQATDSGEDLCMILFAIFGVSNILHFLKINNDILERKRYLAEFCKKYLLIFFVFFSEFSGTTLENGFSPWLSSSDGPALAGRLAFCWPTVLCAHLSAQGWATCSSAEHGGWSSPPVCEPQQQACCRDRVVAGRLRLGFANSLGGVAPPPVCSD